MFGGPFRYRRRFYRRPYWGWGWGRPWYGYGWRPFFMPGCGCGTLIMLLLSLGFLAFLGRIL